MYAYVLFLPQYIIDRQRMGDCLNDLSMGDLKLLEEEMEQATKVIRERKVRMRLFYYAFSDYGQKSQLICIYMRVSPLKFKSS